MVHLSELPRLPYRQWFPWLTLFRAGGLAVGWPQLGISFAAVSAFWVGTAMLERWYPYDTPAAFPMRLIQFEQISDDMSIKPRWVLAPPSEFSGESNPLLPLLVPWNSIVRPLSDLIWIDDRMVVGPGFAPRNTLGSLLNLIFAMAIWSLFGTAICRATAVQMARDRGESFPQAVRYAAGRWAATVGAPSIPAGAIFAVVVSLAIAAWLARFPLIGGPLLTLLSPVWFLAGVTIAFFALVIVCGWPLMVAAMGVEDCDGFGALSRTYSFLAGRPAHAVWNALVSAVYGSVLVAIVGGVFTLGLLAESKPIAANAGDSDNWGAVVQGSHFTAQLLLATFAVSLFWSLVTVNYLLLRQAVDGKPFDDISAGVDDEIGRGLPIVGIPATDYRPRQPDGRPVVTEAESVAPAT